MNIKTIKTFSIGSNAFFSGIPGFTGGHDVDSLNIIDYPLFGETIQIIRKDGRDDLFLYNFGKDKLIKMMKEPIQVGKFLVPEFAKYINLTIEDLKKLKPLLDKIDDKHAYQKLIYNSYIENNGFYLTDEQREAAYQEYKSKRQL